MATKINEIEGIGPVNAEKLEKAEITSVEGLLEKCASKSGRKSVSDATGIDASQLLKWANMADLFRIKGVASEISELLEAAGVDTVKELRNRNPENLHNALVEESKKKNHVRQVPSLSQVESFVSQAKELDPVITY
ncbi:DUF4332 domain-containing protein [Marinigracilibium pacificum]|uniref:DUF4332 domain-containing protein n=1 Tax=Marinigracilibium pacificum TaxID=2729599 RepID=A0A848J408_9BACT|nr:DUF4332 domain-containing protein [Marinigracilibium pacificum]NMM50058.1 DUF4332 domain-containing protein [Marinigracilibium pacificum]